MTDRFANLFNALKAQKDGALVPFVNLCDPTPEKSLEILETLTEAGADAFELGIPFSDPSADGPVICLSSKRALANGSDTQKCLQVVQQYRAKHPDMPISLMIYINLAYAPGLDHFFAQCHEAGVDAVLIPDIPSSMRARESEWDTAARAHDVQLISLVPPNADADKIRRISQHSEGYIYLMSRSGVTGTDRAAGMPTHHVVELMKDAGAPPALLGFGISKPEHVAEAMAHGVDGVIVGSAYVRIINETGENQTLTGIAWRNYTAASTGLFPPDGEVTATLDGTNEWENPVSIGTGADNTWQWTRYVYEGQCASAPLTFSAEWPVNKARTITLKETGKVLQRNTLLDLIITLEAAPFEMTWTYRVVPWEEVTNEVSFD